MLLAARLGFLYLARIDPTLQAFRRPFRVITCLLERAALKECARFVAPPRTSICLLGIFFVGLYSANLQAIP